MSTDGPIHNTRDELANARCAGCDDCDGSGEYLIDNVPQVCICVGEKAPYQRLRVSFAAAEKVVEELKAALAAGGECPGCFQWNSTAPIEHVKNCKIGLALAARDNTPKGEEA